MMFRSVGDSGRNSIPEDCQGSGKLTELHTSDELIVLRSANSGIKLSRMLSSAVTKKLVACSSMFKNFNDYGFHRTPKGIVYIRFVESASRPIYVIIHFFFLYTELPVPHEGRYLLLVLEYLVNTVNIGYQQEMRQQEVNTSLGLLLL